ncbi:hypothetical protein PILCRDRAFT_134010 [Piloderma croceum F 1598]|uniref:Uncharacterized protein n=1 Tax=Piloderma croceum (strain F 1598) TaxID=765440 RepID=A0A0C3BYI5_PILCF|nr:hypothetical protein PILCRDRAFT_134010 [Piloderma croceum F 1598]
MHRQNIACLLNQKPFDTKTFKWSVTYKSQGQGPGPILGNINSNLPEYLPSCLTT